MKKVLFWMLFLMALGAVNVKAQVRIGGNAAPNAAAVLDLNATDATTGTQGLALPRVNLTSNAIQLISGTANLTGMLVYNTTTTLGAGIYFWDGIKWQPITSGSLVEKDSVIGNEVVGATTGGGLVRAGSGTTNSPFTLGMAPLHRHGISCDTCRTVPPNTYRNIHFRDSTWFSTDCSQGFFVGTGSGPMLNYAIQFWSDLITGDVGFRNNSSSTLDLTGLGFRIYCWPIN